jgi:hypothetical protein
VLWFDQDNDGDQDLVVMQRFIPQVIQRTFHRAMPFTAQLLRNDSEPARNWLQLELTGADGNRDAIGAHATLVTSSGRSIQQVGQFDSSHYSQGHYRLYFTYPETATPLRLEVTWPDGTRQRLEHPPAAERIRIAKQIATDVTER